MSHDDTKDLKFNQLYAGRSRSRRDLNTLKTQMVVGHQTSVADGGTGLTKYSLSPRLGGVHQAAHVITFGAGKFITCGPLANVQALDDSTNLGATEVSIPIWRGPGDFSGRLVRGQYQLDLTPDNNTYNILGASMFLFVPFTGVTQAQVSLGVANYATTALINGQDGSGLADMVAASGNTSFPQQSAIQHQAGETLQYGVFPGWTHNQSSATDQNNTGIEQGSGVPVTSGGANFPGVHLNIKVTGAGKNVDDITAGMLLVNLWYSCDPA